MYYWHREYKVHTVTWQLNTFWHHKVIPSTRKWQGMNSHAQLGLLIGLCYSTAGCHPNNNYCYSYPMGCHAFLQGPLLTWYNFVMSFSKHKGKSTRYTVTLTLLFVLVTLYVLDLLRRHEPLTNTYNVHVHRHVHVVPKVTLPNWRPK